MALKTRFSSLEELQKHLTVEDGTESSDEQIRVEQSVLQLYCKFFDRIVIDPDLPTLDRQQHVSLLERSLSYLPQSYECLDASRPWLCYWIVHALQLLDYHLDEQIVDRLVVFLSRCQAADGGFGGGPGQMPHLAATYAAVNALCAIGTERALQVINRAGLSEFLWRCRQPAGSFCMHRGGEVDIRGVYCAISAARLTNVYTDAMFDGTAEWLVSCQTYEGGFSGTPGLEAHGGYTFCGLAALCLLGRERLCDLDALLRWVSCRQMTFEGGFSGRTNKLVDSCYSFWQGASFPIIHTILAKHGSELPDYDGWLFDVEALQHYLLVCCQNSTGGFIDKPNKRRDFYHTCYALSGLSLAQNYQLNTQHTTHGVGANPQQNQLPLIHPVYNIRLEKVIAATRYYGALPCPATPLAETGRTTPSPTGSV